MHAFSKRKNNSNMKGENRHALQLCVICYKQFFRKHADENICDLQS